MHISIPFPANWQQSQEQAYVSLQSNCFVILLTQNRLVTTGKCFQIQLPFQKQSPGGVLYKKSSQKFRNIDKKISVLESLLTLLKETPAQVFSCEYCKIFKNSIFYRAPLLAPAKLFILNSKRNSLFVKSLVMKTSLNVLCRLILHLLCQYDAQNI